MVIVTGLVTRYTNKYPRNKLDHTRWGYNEAI